VDAHPILREIVVFITSEIGGQHVLSLGWLGLFLVLNRVDNLAHLVLGFLRGLHLRLRSRSICGSSDGWLRNRFRSWFGSMRFTLDNSGGCFALGSRSFGFGLGSRSFGFVLESSRGCFVLGSRTSFLQLLLQSHILLDQSINGRLQIFILAPQVSER